MFLKAFSWEPRVHKTCQSSKLFRLLWSNGAVTWACTYFRKNATTNVIHTYEYTYTYMCIYIRMFHMPCAGTSVYITVYIYIERERERHIQTKTGFRAYAFTCACIFCIYHPYAMLRSFCLWSLPFLAHSQRPTEQRRPHIALAHCLLTLFRCPCGSNPQANNGRLHPVTHPLRRAMLE